MCRRSRRLYADPPMGELCSEIAAAVIIMGFLPLICPSAFLGQIEMREVPKLYGAPEEIRTPDPQICSLVTPVT
jgi:hypothetical protein